MVQHLLARKGAPSVARIPGEVLAALNAGQVPTVCLTEFLAVDLACLARHVADHVGLDGRCDMLEDTLAMLPAVKPMRRHTLVARALYQMTLPRADRDAVAHALASHPSDIARGWAAYWVQFSPLALADKLAAVRRFAADPHFGVREIAWMVVRDDVAADVDGALRLLAPWVRDGDENIRRFASEATRPRGVWCAQIEVLKAEPWRALALLEPLKADPSRYVQNSVANWLNDASKSQPHWVRTLVQQWQQQGNAAMATNYIARRALRTLNAAGCN